MIFLLNKLIFPYQAINDRLPKLARQKNDALIETTQGATSKLDVIPSSTIEFVESLTFLDEIQEKTQVGIEFKL